MLSHSEMSQSPRFQITPTLAQPAHAKPDDLCKDLLASLDHGMQGLQQFAPKGDLDPNTRIVKVTDPTTGIPKLEHQQIGVNFGAKAVGNERYQWSAIGEMNNEQLDQLRVKNEERMAKLEQKYGEDMG